VVSGGVQLVQSGRRQRVGPGEAFILRKGEPHRFATATEGFVHKRMVIIEGIMLEVVLQSLGLHTVDRIVLPRPRYFESLLRKSTKLVGSRDDNRMWDISLLAYTILLELSKGVLYRDIPEGVALAVEFMNRNMEKNLSLKDIAQRSGLSVYHFSRLFSRTLKVPPMAFFNQQKMTFACNLLAN
jgi:hypothetical protein